MGTMADQRMIGKTGRVTGTVRSGRVGEVIVVVRGGAEHFHAYVADADDVIERGSSVVVVDYLPPRSVVVSPI